MLSEGTGVKPETFTVSACAVNNIDKTECPCMQNVFHASVDLTTVWV